MLTRQRYQQATPNTNRAITRSNHLQTLEVKPRQTRKVRVTRMMTISGRVMELNLATHRS
jgi:hypothetical protein